MELYGTQRLGEKFRNFMKLYNWSDGTEQLCFNLTNKSNLFDRLHYDLVRFLIIC